MSVSRDVYMQEGCAGLRDMGLCATPVSRKVYLQNLGENKSVRKACVLREKEFCFYLFLTPSSVPIVLILVIAMGTAHRAR